jgi:hypothetical protein
MQLCHYTSGQGLMGILDSRSVWASNIHQLNDAKEFRHAFALAQDALRQSLHDADERLQAIVHALCRLLERAQSLSVHVTSFSEDGDSLSQWRGYCPDGFGYCIEFDLASLAAAALAHGFTLKRCLYEEAQQRSWMAQWARSCLSAAVVPFGPDSDDSLYKRCYSHMNTLMLEAPFFKHPSFAAEREWRLAKVVYADDPDLRVRAGKSMLVRYVPVGLDLSPASPTIYSIRVGPTPHPQLALEGLTYYFHRIGIANGVCNSKVPYRAW